MRSKGLHTRSHDIIRSVIKDSDTKTTGDWKVKVSAKVNNIKTERN